MIIKKKNHFRLIEQCYNLRDRYVRVNDKMEAKKMSSIAEKAHEYRVELQKLLDLNFDNPNEELKEFAKKSNMDLKDPKVQKYFLEIRKKYLEDINKFYENNFLNFNKNPMIKNGPVKNNNKKDSIIKNSKISENKTNKQDLKEIKNSNLNKEMENERNGNQFKNINNNKKTIKNEEREFLKKKENNESFLYSIQKYISPPIFCGVLLISLVLFYFKNY